jgi:hypothetical protein
MEIPPRPDDWVVLDEFRVTARVAADLDEADARRERACILAALILAIDGYETSVSRLWIELE